MARYSYGRDSLLYDQFLDDVISDIKNMFPEVIIVQYSPRLSGSNRGIKRMNFTVDKNQVLVWKTKIHNLGWLDEILYSGVLPHKSIKQL